MSKSYWEKVLNAEIESAGLPTPKREVRFSPLRRFRADLLFPDTVPPVVVEIMGGTWTGGRHVRGNGYESDCEKLNLLSLMGFRVFYFTGEMIDDGRAIKTLKEVFNGAQE